MTVEAMFEHIRILSAQVRDAHVRALLFAFLDDGELAPAFLRAPAAKSIHHAYPGGLCEHTLSVMQLGWRICDHYPQLDRDLVTAGCLLHDIGKARDLPRAWLRVHGRGEAGRTPGAHLPADSREGLADPGIPTGARVADHAPGRVPPRAARVRQPQGAGHVRSRSGPC